MESGDLATWILGAVLVLSSLGVILIKKPVHASLSFLLTLLSLAALYLQLSAEFIAVMQVLVYAGAILVIFMFVVILFQDAYKKIDDFSPQSFRPLLIAAAVSFLIAAAFLAYHFRELKPAPEKVSENYGNVEALGKLLYFDFFFPFEVVIPMFLVAGVGALYIGKKPEKHAQEIS